MSAAHLMTLFLVTQGLMLSGVVNCGTSSGADKPAPPRNAPASLHTPAVVAHRGLLRHAPENTLANFRACLELRLGFEFDVRVTSDGHLVCLHDQTVNRTTNGKGAVQGMTLKTLRELDAGSWFDPRFRDEKVPTIDEVMQLVAQSRRHNVLIAVDVKAADVEAELVRLAERHQVLDRLLFIGRTIEEGKVRDNLKKASSKAQTAAVANFPTEFERALATKNADWVYFRFVPTSKQIAAVRRAGKRAFIAGITVGGNLPHNWTYATEAGVDGILTDYPLELSNHLRSRPRLPTPQTPRKAQ